MKTALLAGATGLVGRELLGMLLAETAYTKVMVLARRPLGLQHEKLVEIRTAFTDLAAIQLPDQVTDAFCTLGTTMKKAGSQEAFYQVDYTFVEATARLALQYGAESFSAVSAVGADTSSAFYYSRVKGEAEKMLRSLPFKRLHIYRPSLLLGQRDEVRLGEDIGKVVNLFTGWLLPGRYKGIQATDVAKAMWLMALKTPKQGSFVYESDVIRKIAKAGGE